MSDEIDFKRLNDINSRVIKELSHSFAKMESIYDEYKNVFYRHNTLLSRLGKPTLEEDSFNNAAEMIARIDTIKAENESLHQQLLAIAERQEICNSIDKAMISLGYDLIGTKNASTKGCAKLYQFSKGTGIQMIQKEDGTVRLKVVGLSKRNRPPRESEKSICCICKRNSVLHMNKSKRRLFVKEYVRFKGPSVSYHRIISFRKLLMWMSIIPPMEGKTVL